MSTLSRILNRGRFPEGEEELERLGQVLEQDPLSTQFVLLADRLLRRGMHDDAIALCQRGLASHPNYASGHLALARAYQLSGDLERAAEAFRRVVELAPDNIAGHLGLSELYEMQGRLGDATVHIRAAMQLGADGPAVRERLERVSQVEEPSQTGPAPAVGNSVESASSALELLKEKQDALEAFRRRFRTMGATIGGGTSE